MFHMYVTPVISLDIFASDITFEKRSIFYFRAKGRRNLVHTRTARYVAHQRQSLRQSCARLWKCKDVTYLATCTYRPRFTPHTKIVLVDGTVDVYQ